MKRNIYSYIEDILEHLFYIEEYTAGLTQQDFFTDTKTQQAVTRCFEVIGEAVKSIPSTIKQKHKEIDWIGLAGLRDILIHAYFKVNLERIWFIIEEELPTIKQQFSKILKELEK